MAINGSASIRTIYQTLNASGISGNFSVPSTLSAKIDAIPALTFHQNVATYISTVTASVLITLGTKTSLLAAFSDPNNAFLLGTTWAPTYNDHLDGILDGSIGLPGGDYLSTLTGVDGFANSLELIGEDPINISSYYGFLLGEFDDLIDEYLAKVTAGSPTALQTTMASVLGILAGVGPDYDTLLLGYGATITSNCTTLRVSDTNFSRAKAIYDLLRTQKTLENSSLTGLADKIKNLGYALTLYSTSTGIMKPLLENTGNSIILDMVDAANVGTTSTKYPLLENETIEMATDRYMLTQGRPRPTSTLLELVIKANLYKSGITDNLTDIHNTTQIMESYRKALLAYSIDWTNGEFDDIKLYKPRLEYLVAKDERAKVKADIEAYQELL